MYLSQKLLEKAIQPNPDGSSGLILDLSLKQLAGLKGVERFLEPNEIEKLLLSTNYIAELDQNFHLFNTLRELDVSINHISRIENLESLVNLKFLNLSNNRISKIENLDVLKNLEVLDLSMNYLERIENLRLKSLKTLILSGNNIRELENLHHVRQLQNLEIEKNGIDNINSLAVFGLRDLRKIVFAYNKIPVEQFDDLLMLIQAMPTLEELNFIGNEITLHKMYKPKIMQFSNIQVLDKLALKDPIKKHFEALRQEDDLKNLVEQTKQEYLDRMEKENQLKATALEMIEKQKQQVDQIFDEHMKTLQDDLQCFYERAQELKKKRLEGLDENATEDILQGWQAGVKKSAIEKRQAYEDALKRQQQLQREYLEAELTSKKFTEKLYEISMKRPEIWKDIKLREQDQFMEEENQANLAKRINPNADESELRHYQALANQIQVNMIKDVANAVIDYEAKELHDQREKAATVLKHALLKQMVNHYKGLKQNNHPVEDDEEEENEFSQRDKERLNKFDTTDEQLKKMLYSRSYKDGQWRDDKVRKDGPNDLSNQSLHDLLKIQGGQAKGKKKTTKTNNRSPQHMIPEEDEDGYGIPDQHQQRRLSPVQNKPNFQYDDVDLERDPFEGDGATYYDEKHVVGEKDGQKIILIPFEDTNTNVLGSVTGLGNSPPKKNQQQQQQKQPVPEKKPVEKPKQVTSTKKRQATKNGLDNLLADLDKYDINGNRAPSMNIPDYQLRNRPYQVLDQQQEPHDPFNDGTPYTTPRDETRKSTKKKKKTIVNMQPEQDPQEMPIQPNQQAQKENGKKGKGDNQVEPTKKSSACNMF